MAMTLLVPLALGQCTDSNETVEQTARPRVFDNVAVKLAPEQRSVDFYLTDEFADADLDDLATFPPSSVRCTRSPFSVKRFFFK